MSPGSLRDYKLFESMHYRQRRGLGPFDNIFVLRDGRELLGVVVYGYAALSLHLRNVALGPDYHRNGRLINRDIRVLRRLVIHPDVRGCGLAHYLVRRTLTRAGTKYVECLAAMGVASPVFERAGMVRLGSVDVAGLQARLRERLGRLGVDPFARDFAQAVAQRQEVRDLVRTHVRRWVEAGTSRPVERVLAMSAEDLASGFVQMMGTAPVYYLWSTEEAENARLREVARVQDASIESDTKS